MEELKEEGKAEAELEEGAERQKIIIKFKRKQLISFLSSIENFDQPKVKLEQYMTPPHIAADIFAIINVSFIF